AEGEHEFTMDEVEIIQNHLLSQAGENTDVILGLGYDNSLGSQIGITLIATGFQHKDPFSKREAPKQEAPKQEKIVMTLGEQPSPKPQATIQPPKEDLLAPKLIDENSIAEENPAPQLQDAKIDLHLGSLSFVEEKEEEPEAPVHLQLKIKDEAAEADAEKKELEQKKQWLDDRFEKLRQSILSTDNKAAKPEQNTSSTSAASGGYLARPSNIYAESKPEVSTSKPAEEKPVPAPVAKVEDPETFDMQLVIRNDIPKAAETPTSHHTHPDNYREPQTPQAEESHIGNDAEDQKRRAAERLQKLRNLSFNINAADPNNEFEAVPAYIRRNMELYNTVSSVENFYSNYTVKDDGKGSANISTINTFLDGKKPD
ncbi:MAG: cell division protein FtsZ, partial [Flavisolibacter sp.]